MKSPEHGSYNLMQLVLVDSEKYGICPSLFDTGYRGWNC